MEPRKEAIIEALAKFVRQRPGLEYGNYGDRASYQSEMRSIARDKREAQTLLAAISWRDSITADDLIAAAEGAFSGRLTIIPATGPSPYGDADTREWDIGYCAGQYFPTEYRKAVAAVLASALWTYTREHAMPKVGTAPCGSGKAEAGMYFDGKRAVSAGDWLRAHFRKEFGRGLASRWF